MFQRKFIFVIVSFAMVLLNAILRGGKTDSFAGITQCSALDWTTFALISLALFIVSISSILMLKSEYRKKVRVGYKFHKSDV